MDYQEASARGSSRQASRFAVTTDQIVRNYQRFLEKSWQTFEALRSLYAEWESLVSDWLQANWGLLVEALVCPDPEHFLEVYGEGAEEEKVVSDLLKLIAEKRRRLTRL